MKWLWESTFCNEKHWQSQIFEMILPSWWCKRLTILVGGQETEAGQWDQYRSWTDKKQKVGKHSATSKTLFKDIINPGNVCWAWMYFLTNTLISIYTILGTPGSCKSTHCTLMTSGLSPSLKGTSVVVTVLRWRFVDVCFLMQIFFFQIWTFILVKA